MPAQYVRIIGHVARTTDRAIQMKAGRDDKLWIPRTVVKNGDFVEAGDVQIKVNDDWLFDNNASSWEA